MIAPINEPVQKKVIKLLPQEQEGTYKFNGQFVATAAAVEKFGHATIVGAHILLLKEVARRGGLDYLQVFEIDGEKLWFIDDITHVTALLPDDY
jgi:hypothetical protein